MIRKEARLAKARKKIDRTSKAIQSETGEAGRTLVSGCGSTQSHDILQGPWSRLDRSGEQWLVRVVRQGAERFLRECNRA